MKSKVIFSGLFSLFLLLAGCQPTKSEIPHLYDSQSTDTTITSTNKSEDF